MSPFVKQYLLERKAQFRIHEHAEIATAAQAKEHLDFPVSSMVKCLAFAIPDSQFVIVGLRADDRADYKKISAALNVSRQALRPADEIEVVEHLKMIPGGIGPFAEAPAKLIIDDAIVSLEVIYCGSGIRNTTVEISARELIRISQPEILNVRKEP